MSWLARDPSDVGLDPSDYSDGQIPLKDSVGFVPGAATTLSDASPLPVDDVAVPGAAPTASRADHVHTLGVLDSLSLVSPDGTLWTVTVTDLGALTTDEVEARITEDGDFRITEDGGLRVLEG